MNLYNHLKDYVEDEGFDKVPEIGKCMPNAILNNLVNNCMDYLIFHEFFHIMNGHCDYANEIGINELCEVNNECLNRGMIRQTLELDADCCSIASIVNEYFRSQYSVIQSIPGMTGRPNLDSTIQFISTLLISIYIMTEWLNIKKYSGFEVDENILETMSHPLPGTRAMYIWANIFTIIDKLNIYNNVEVDDIAKRSCDALLIFIEEFKDIAYPGFLKISYDDIGIKHLQKIHDNWESTRELLKMNYNGLAPYEKFDIISTYKLNK